MKKLFILSSILALCAFLYAADQGGGNDTGNSSGIPSVKIDGCRWTTVRVSTFNGSPTVVVTNALTSSSSVIGGIILIPGGAGDTISVYNAASAAGASNSQRIAYFKVPDSITNATPPMTAGVPYEVPMPKGGISAPLGIVIMQQMGVTNDGFEVYVNYDKAISGRK